VPRPSGVFAKAAVMRSYASFRGGVGDEAQLLTLAAAAAAARGAAGRGEYGEEGRDARGREDA
jgi:hypothetical protein